MRSAWSLAAHEGEVEAPCANRDVDPKKAAAKTIGLVSIFTSIRAAVLPVRLSG